tara:strand:- start:1074 stop:1337 length:264 start_codon:yes stop_codon:yes gene_type:complete
MITITKEEILKIVDKCFHSYASSFRNEAKQEATILIDKHLEAINYTHCCKSDSEQLVLFADWLQYNGRYSLPKQQAKDFLKEQQEQN